MVMEYQLLPMDIDMRVNIKMVVLMATESIFTLMGTNTKVSGTMV